MADETQPLYPGEGSTDADKLQGRYISAIAPADGNALEWDDTLKEWKPAAASSESGDVFTALDFTGSNLTSLATRNFSDLQNIPSTSNTIYVDVAGNDSTGLRGRQDKPLLTVAAAAGASGITSGDVIRIGAGNFTENSGVVLPSGVSLIGAGEGVTIINSSLPSSTHPIIVLSSNQVISDLTINGTLTNGTHQCPIGMGSGSGTNIVWRNIRMSGDSDGTQSYSTSSGVFLRAFNCTFLTKYDAVQIIRGSAEFYDCAVVVTGPSSDGAGISTGVVAISSGANAGKIYWYGGSVSVDGATGTNSAFETRGSGSSGLIEAHNVRLHRGISASNNYDLNANSAGAVIYYNNVTRDDGAALITSGTVTQISRYALRDNNLSDLVDLPTARTNLGLGTMATQADSAVSITGGTLAGLTGLAIRDTSAAYDVTLTATSSTTISTARALTLDLVNGSRTLKLGGNLDVGGGGTLGTAAFTATGAYDAAGAAAAVTPTSLGLVIGTNVQAYDADLTTWAGVTPGTGVATALAVNIGTAGGVQLNNGSGTGLTGIAPLASPTFTGTVTSPNFTLSGNQSAAAWTTSGLRLVGIAGTLTDTTSSGTVAAAYTNKLGGNTIASSGTVTFTDYISAYFSDPVQGTGVTLTNKWGLGADSLKVGTSNPFKITSAGAASAYTLAIGAGSAITTSGPGGAMASGAYAAAFDPTAPGAIGGGTPNTGAFTSETFTLSLQSTTALATPSALSATQASFFASTVSGATLMGYGTTNDVSLKNRAGTTVLGVGPNTTTVNVPGEFTIGSSSDAGISRNAAGVVEVNGGTAGQYGILKAGGFSFQTLADPAAPAVVSVGTAGTTTYAYSLALEFADGTSTRFINTNFTTGNATLNGSNFNRITIPVLTAGATRWVLYRSFSNGTPSTLGRIANSAGSTTFDDTGVATIGALLSPNVNSTGNLSIPQYLTFPNGSSGSVGTCHINFPTTALYDSGGNQMGFLANGTLTLAFGNYGINASFVAGSGFQANTTGVIKWSTDAGYSRISAGLIGVGTGAQGSFAGRTKQTSVIYAGTTIAALNASPTTGEVASITDGDSGLAWGATAVNTGSGATKYLVWYNGSAWTVTGK